MNYGGIDSKFSELNNSEVVILPVPYDATSTWIKGADHGPDAIFEASENMELYDIETGSEVFKKGIYTAPPVKINSDPEVIVNHTKKEVLNYLSEGKYVVTIGGNHTVSIGAIYAHVEKFNDITVLQLDAHSDLRDNYEDSKFNHACVMARAKEVASVVQVGIRSMAVEECEVIDKRTTFYAHKILNSKIWKAEVTKLLKKNVYITIDLDVFDPSIMPSTGTPEPGGLSYYDVLDLIKIVNLKCNIVGFDVVELCPNKTNKSPDFLAAKLIYQILSYKFSSKNRKK